MNLLDRIRRIRSLPRLALAIVVLATVQIGFVRCAMATEMASAAASQAMIMEEHCAYCPPAVHEDGSCGFPHSASEAIGANTQTSSGQSSGQSGVAFWDAPALLTTAFTLSELRRSPIKVPRTYSSLPSTCRLNLRYCVQLK
jgi:hypothetical protein